MHAETFWCLLSNFYKYTVLSPAFNTAKCEKLQKEKEELEKQFENEVRKLGWQQQAELQDLQGQLQLQFHMEMTRLQEEHSAQLLRIRCQHQEQVRVCAVLCLCCWDVQVEGSGKAMLLEPKVLSIDELLVKFPL